MSIHRDRETRFLTAEWRHLAMINYEVDPGVLEPLVPRGTELDSWQGRTFASVVGFQFLNTRVLGIPVPFHRDFEEVNLRFYVRRKVFGEGWRRGVVFVKEIVPRVAIAWVARTLYGENYVTLPMRHEAGVGSGGNAGERTIRYSWWFRGQENGLEVTVEGDAARVAPGSSEEFITEHYWGYSRWKGGRTTEYRVAHPRWSVFRTTAARLDCDVAALYGEAFVDFLQAPVSAFLADGSEVSVFRGTLLDGQR